MVREATRPSCAGTGSTGIPFLIPVAAGVQRDGTLGERSERRVARRRAPVCIPLDGHRVDNHAPQRQPPSLGRFGGTPPTMSGPRSAVLVICGITTAPAGTISLRKTADR